MSNLISDTVKEQLFQLWREFQSREQNVRGRTTPFGTQTQISLAKTTTTHSKGTSANVDLYAGATKGSESTTGVTVSAYNRFADLATAKWCVVVFIGGAWELISGEC